MLSLKSAYIKSSKTAAASGMQNQEQLEMLKQELREREHSQS